MTKYQPLSGCGTSPCHFVTVEIIKYRRDKSQQKSNESGLKI